MPGRLAPPALAVALLLAAAAGPASAARPATIPALREWRAAPGAFVLRPSSRVLVPGGGRVPLSEARLFASDLRRLTGRATPVLDGPGLVPGPGDVELRLGSTDRGLGSEGYRLEVGAALRIEARTAAGVFYGTRSVLQLLHRRRTIPAGPCAGLAALPRARSHDRQRPQVLRPRLDPARGP